LAIQGRIVGWTAGIYEPEVVAFGGAAAMDVAHELFHDDCRTILEWLGRTGTVGTLSREIGRRELALLLCSVLLRGGGQDWFEQGDVWARVLQYRPTHDALPPPGRLRVLRPAMYRLMTVDVSPTSALVAGGPLAAMSGWLAAFQRAGQKLADLARRGELERGLRAVLTHHVIFHWNRLGLSYAEQSTLAALAKEVVMADPDGATSGRRWAVPELQTWRLR
jgi:protein-L-isoaspartate(D-aspartate) O-methyltransferase